MSDAQISFESDDEPQFSISFLSKVPKEISIAGSPQADKRIMMSEGRHQTSATTTLPQSSRLDKRPFPTHHQVYQSNTGLMHVDSSDKLLMPSLSPSYDTLTPEKGGGGNIFENQNQRRFSQFVYKPPERQMVKTGTELVDVRLTSEPTGATGQRKFNFIFKPRDQTRKDVVE